MALPKTNDLQMFLIVAREQSFTKAAVPGVHPARPHSCGIEVRVAHTTMTTRGIRAVLPKQ